MGTSFTMSSSIFYSFESPTYQVQSPTEHYVIYIFFCIYFYLVGLFKHLRGITLWYQQNDSLQSFHFKGGRHAACHPWLVIARSNQIPQWAIDHAKLVGHSKWNLIFSKIRQIIINIESNACGLLKIPPIVVLCQ